MAEEEESGKQSSFLEEVEPEHISQHPPSHKVTKRKKTFPTIPDNIGMAITCFLLVGDILIFFVSRAYAAAITVFVFLLGCWFVWAHFKNQQITLSKLLIAFLVGIVIIAGGGFGISKTIGKDWDVAYNPTLSLGKQPADITLSDNQTSHIENAKLAFHIFNIGNKAAYQIREQICIVEKGALITDTLEPKFVNADTTDVDPINPQEGIVIFVTIPQPYNDDNGTKVFSINTWFIYCKITYRDAIKGGNSYPPTEGWYRYETSDTSGLWLLNTEEQKLFLPAINVLVAK